MVEEGFFLVHPCGPVFLAFTFTASINELFPPGPFHNLKGYPHGCPTPWVMISGVSLEKSPRLPSLEGEGNSGIGGGKVPPAQQYGGGGRGGRDERVFFDDGQVKVTESLVTIGPPWNKAFAVSQIRGVTYGKNKSTELTDSLMRLIGMILIFAGVLSLAAGFTAGFFAGVFTGIGVLWGKSKADAPYSVNLDFGGVLSTECLSTKSEAWAGAVANAIREAIRQGRDSGGEGFIPGPSETRN